MAQVAVATPCRNPTGKEQSDMEKSWKREVCVCEEYMRDTEPRYVPTISSFCPCDRFAAL